LTRKRRTCTHGTGIAGGSVTPLMREKALPLRFFDPLSSGFSDFFPSSKGCPLHSRLVSRSVTVPIMPNSRRSLCNIVSKFPFRAYILRHKLKIDEGWVKLQSVQFKYSFRRTSSSKLRIDMFQRQLQNNEVNSSMQCQCQSR
jgi:hypothetical protein